MALCNATLELFHIYLSWSSRHSRDFTWHCKVASWTHSLVLYLCGLSLHLYPVPSSFWRLFTKRQNTASVEQRPPAMSSCVSHMQRCTRLSLLLGVRERAHPSDNWHNFSIYMYMCVCHPCHQIPLRLSI